jgi:hypothetical protein
MVTIGGSNSRDYAGSLHTHQGYPNYNVGGFYQQYWLFNYSGARYGGMSLASELGGNLVEFDTGASFIYLKEFEYNKLRPVLASIPGMSCSLNCFNTSPCSEIMDQMEPLTICIDS